MPPEGSMNTAICRLNSLIRLVIPAVLIVFGTASSPALAQQVAISLSSGSSAPGGSAALNISLTTSGGAQPASVQWTMSYLSSDIANVSVTLGPAIVSKTVSCSSTGGSTMCVAFGMNNTIIGNGILATGTFSIASGALDASAQVQVTAVMASDANGNAIPVSGSGGTISISQPILPTVSSLSCTPTSVSAPGSAACTVTLSAPAQAGGFGVTLASNNPNVT